ncbi:MAG: hypothetical protein Q4G68_14355 [Planctomycetia bacterium]|nr:hypothetical protein [Planctomycetia bacterium]
MAIMIREFWLEHEVPLNCKISPPVGVSVNRVKCCIDLTCTFDAAGRVVIQRMTLARGMKKNKYNVETDKAGPWLADQRCEMAVNQYLKGYGNHVLEAEPALRNEIDRHRQEERLTEAAVPGPKKHRGAAATLIGGACRLLLLLVKLVFMLISVIIRSVQKKSE